MNADRKKIIETLNDMQLELKNNQKSLVAKINKIQIKLSSFYQLYAPNKSDEPVPFKDSETQNKIFQNIINDINTLEDIISQVFLDLEKRITEIKTEI
ncbi:MAG: hypothetical protein EU551_01770 [Promethearchaeota archaeon]|nr:MAG: hypothetical protein EU551_01770 [Candidatus Lokiarchaeota archaeon]